MTPMARCAAAHAEDPTDCGGDHEAVTIRDAAGSETTGCVHHGSRLLASLRGGTIHPGPAGLEGAAIDALTRARSLPPYPWRHDTTGER